MAFFKSRRFQGEARKNVEEWLILKFDKIAMPFQLEAEFSPTGDQPEAIKQLVDGFNGQEKFMTLQGVTGSGKTLRWPMW